MYYYWRAIFVHRFEVGGEKHTKFHSRNVKHNTILKRTEHKAEDGGARMETQIFNLGEKQHQLLLNRPKPCGQNGP